jgi:hypothetical protein
MIALPGCSQKGQDQYEYFSDNWDHCECPADRAGDLLGVAEHEAKRA